MKTLLKPTKKYLLSILTIGEFFKARKNIRLSGTLPWLDPFHKLNSMFPWFSTPEGSEYWRDRHNRLAPINENWVTRLVKKLIILLPIF